ncbi:MAG: sensor histidine kinase [Hassallia sp. WJT32-NPBG1]|nr:sensor histidine kinase [Hassallia sp. WJT32-NPBG1]
MTRPIEFKNHPFRFLLYLEWILLAFSAISAVLPFKSEKFQTNFPELAISCLVIFGLMGLRLPTNNQRNKLLYTGLEIILILITAFLGGGTARFFPFLNMIIVTRSCLIFQLTGRLVVASLSFVLILVSLAHRFSRFPLPPRAQERFWFLTFSFMVSFGLALVFVLLLMNAVLSERQSREKLAIANEKLRQYALKIENQATLEERNRIAREIHDSLGHSLTALNLQLETALKLWQSNPSKAQSFLARAKELGSKALQDVRQSVSTMRSHPLHTQSLEEAIAVLAEDFYRSTGVVPICQIDLAYPLPPEISTAIYRIIQESLTNISKYANATEIKIQLTMTKNINLIIEDNGRGFDVEQNTTGFGLQSMRDRTLARGGEFKIYSAPAFGCKITVDIPFS